MAEFWASVHLPFWVVLFCYFTNQSEPLLRTAKSRQERVPCRVQGVVTCAVSCKKVSWRVACRVVKWACRVVWWARREVGVQCSGREVGVT